MTACVHVHGLKCVLLQFTTAQLLPLGSRFRADIVGYGTARDEHSTFTCYTVHVTRLPSTSDDLRAARGPGSPPVASPPTARAGGASGGFGAIEPARSAVASGTPTGCS